MGHVLSCLMPTAERPRLPLLEGADGVETSEPEEGSWSGQKANELWLKAAQKLKNQKLTIQLKISSSYKLYKAINALISSLTQAILIQYKPTIRQALCQVLEWLFICFQEFTAYDLILLYTPLLHKLEGEGNRKIYTTSSCNTRIEHCDSLHSREAKQISQGHTAGKQQRQTSPGN